MLEDGNAPIVPVALRTVADAVGGMAASPVPSAQAPALAESNAAVAIAGSTAMHEALLETQRGH
jgi:hypothetical protein